MPSATDELTDDAIADVKIAAARLARLVNDSPAAVKLCELIDQSAGVIETLVNLR